LNSANLEKIYLVYIRQIFEYACEVWDTWGIGYSVKLEKLQLDIAKIVTDLHIFTKSDSICMPRQVGKHYKSKCITENFNYNKRSGTWILVSFCSSNYSEYYYIPLANWRSFNGALLYRLSITNSSFIPYTVKEWNKLDIAIRKLDSLFKFKKLTLFKQPNK
jgi:hypothetical protein